MKIQQSAEDYLEAMLMLREENGYIRSVDISRKLNVTKPSVSYATKRLRENGYIVVDDDGMIKLTDSGMEIAQKIYDRHKALIDTLTLLGVSREVAEEDACKIEHAISDETYAAICDFLGKNQK